MPEWGRRATIRSRLGLVADHAPDVPRHALGSRRMCRAKHGVLLRDPHHEHPRGGVGLNDGTTPPPPRRGRATGPWGAAVLPIAPWPKRHGALRCSMVQRKQDEGVAALALAKATSPDFVGYWQRHRVI